jgi:putative transcriptional regulator
LSREEFSKAFGIPVAILSAWERHESEPDETALAYLRVIAAKPNIVRKVLEVA